MTNRGAPSASDMNDRMFQVALLLGVEVSEVLGMLEGAAFAEPTTEPRTETPRTEAGPLRQALQERGWFVADVVTAEWVESSEWEPVLLAAGRAAALGPDSELRRLSEAATPGPWLPDGWGLWIGHVSGDGTRLFDADIATEADAEFAAAAVNAVRTALATDSRPDSIDAASEHRMGPPQWEPGNAQDEWTNRCLVCRELWPCDSAIDRRLAAALHPVEAKKGAGE